MRALYQYVHVSGCSSIRLQMYMLSMSWDHESTSETFGDASIALHVPYLEIDLFLRHVCYQYGFKSNSRLGKSRIWLVSYCYSRNSMPAFSSTSILHAVAQFTLHPNHHPCPHESALSSPEALLPFPRILNTISHALSPVLHAIPQSLQRVSDRFARATRHAGDRLPDASACGADDAAGRFGDSGDPITQGGGDEADRIVGVGVV